MGKCRRSGCLREGTIFLTVSGKILDGPPPRIDLSNRHLVALFDKLGFLSCPSFMTDGADPDHDHLNKQVQDWWDSYMREWYD